MGGVELVPSTAEEEDESRPEPNQHRECRNESARGGNRIIVDEDVSDEDSDVNIDIEGEDEEGGDDNAVKIDEEVVIEIVGDSEFSKN